jgi:HK97 family phage major capsid protein
MITEKPKPSTQAALVRALREAQFPVRRTKHRYSLSRAIRSAIANKSSPFKPAGLEGEVSAEIAMRTGRSPQGFFMPLDVPLEQRIDTTVTGAGAAATRWPPLMFIDVLRAKLVVSALGGQITTLSSERGAVQLPVQSAATPVTWVAEGSAAGGFTGLTIGSVVFTPHTLLANTGISRFLEELAAPGFDAWLYSELAADIAVGIDLAAIAGTGAANQPTGLISSSQSTVYTLAADAGNGGAPAYVDLVGMESAAAIANVDSRADARMGWLTSPAGRSKLRRVDSSSANAAQWCWAKDWNTVLGTVAMATTNCPANLTKGTGTNLSALIYGDWTNLVVNLFSAVDILINPYTISTTGYYQIYAYQECDVQILRSPAFQVVKAMITT